jgi:dienelactone hydrolase
MAIKVTCDSCFMDFSIKDELAGKKIKCKECGEVMRVSARQARADDDDDEFGEDAAAAPMAAPRARPGKTKTGPKRGGKKSSPLKMPLIVAGLVVGGLGLAIAAVVVLHQFDRSKAGPPGPVVVQPGGGSVPTGTPGIPGMPGMGLPGAAPAGAAKDANSLFPVSTLPVPKFPNLGKPRKAPGTQVSVYDLHLADANAQSRAPGFFMHLRVYLPPGEHADKSLGCVLVAPAGTNLLVGNDVDDFNYHAETLPYAQAGYVAIMYGLDGPVANLQNLTNAQLARAYQEFSAAFAGVANARNALEFALAKLPQVNPERIFAAGHSSAAVVSLLFAEHEPRLKGCLAYAAASDVEARLAPIVNDRQAQALLPGLRDFAKRSSPRTHVAHLNCPVFLFHARDDSNEPFTTSQQFAAGLQQLGKKVTFESSPTGDHYDSMIQVGIPRAIAWMKSLPGEAAGK